MSSDMFTVQSTQSTLEVRVLCRASQGNDMRRDNYDLVKVERIRDGVQALCAEDCMHTLYNS